MLVKKTVSVNFLPFSNQITEHQSFVSLGHWIFLIFLKIRMDSSSLANIKCKIRHESRIF